MIADGPLELRARRLMRRQPELHYSRLPIATSTDAPAVFTLQANGVVWHGAVVESDLPIAEREPYDETPIASRAVIEDTSIRVAGLNGMHPIEVITSLTLLLHQRLFKIGDDRKWYLARTRTHAAFAGERWGQYPDWLGAAVRYDNDALLDCCRRGAHWSDRVYCRTDELKPAMVKRSMRCSADSKFAEELPLRLTAPAFDEAEVALLRDCLDSGWVTQGPLTERFERLMAERHQARFAFATTSCTAALHLAMMALHIGHGDEVHRSSLHLGDDRSRL